MPTRLLARFAKTLGTIHAPGQSGKQKSRAQLLCISDSKPVSGEEQEKIRQLQAKAKA
jgi:hypothetical protein